MYNKILHEVLDSLICYIITNDNASVDSSQCPSETLSKEKEDNPSTTSARFPYLLVDTGHDRHVQGAEIIPRTRPKQLAAELQQFFKRIHQLPQHISLSEGIHNGQPQPPETLIPRLPNPLLDVHLQRHQRKARGGQELRERLPPAEDLLHGEQADADARDEFAALGDDGSDGFLAGDLFTDFADVGEEIEQLLESGDDLAVALHWFLGDGGSEMKVRG